MHYMIVVMDSIYSYVIYVVIICHHLLLCSLCDYQLRMRILILCWGPACPLYGVISSPTVGINQSLLCLYL